MLKEFKEFINQGNAKDLAVGVIIGAAFKAIVDSLVGDIISPLIGMITGGINFDALSLKVGSAELMYGKFITALINFLIVAFVLFLIVKGLNKAHEKNKKIAEKVTTKVATKVPVRKTATKKK